MPIQTAAIQTISTIVYQPTISSDFLVVVVSRGEVGGGLFCVALYYLSTLLISYSRISRTRHCISVPRIRIEHGILLRSFAKRFYSGYPETRRAVRKLGRRCNSTLVTIDVRTASIFNVQRKRCPAVIKLVRPRNGICTRE